MTDALIEEVQPAEHAAPGGMGTVPIDSIIVPPAMARDHGDLAGLVASIKRHGVLNPPTVSQTPGGYVLVAGGRRVAAARLAGLTEIPIHAKQDATELGVSAMRLSENLQRHNLPPLEEALGYRDLMSQHGLTQQQVAREVGRSPLHVSNRLKLLRLHPEVAELVAKPDGLSIGEAEHVARLSDQGDQRRAATEIMGGHPAEEVVQRHLQALDRANRVQSARDQLTEGGETEFTGQLGVDGFLLSPEPEPGKLYWPADRERGEDVQWQVNADGSVVPVSTNPGAWVHDEDPQVAESARKLMDTARVATGEAGTEETPLQPLAKDEAEKEREKAVRAVKRMLKRRDEEREAHLSKLVRRGVNYPKQGEFVLRAYLAAANPAVREVAYARCRVPKDQREDGFGEEWKLEQFLAESKGDGLLRLAYAVALQQSEDLFDRGVAGRVEADYGANKAVLQGYLDHLGTTGYPGSVEEFQLIGEDLDEDRPEDTDQQDDGEES